MASTTRDIVPSINAWYDWSMYLPIVRERTGDFNNYGYWLPDTRTHKGACENLMEKLLGFIPEKKGRILDVACGKGATARYLARYYDPSQITGINISSKQLRTCRRNAPGCTFCLMSATNLEFAECSFENIICVESAFHFQTRDKFLREAFRVLKPGGRLVLSDILIARTFTPKAFLVPSANYVGNLREYVRRYHASGFNDLRVVDATEECWIEYCFHQLHFLRLSVQMGQLSGASFRRAKDVLLNKALKIRHYLLVSARKPI